MAISNVNIAAELMLNINCNTMRNQHNTWWSNVATLTVHLSVGIALHQYLVVLQIIEKLSWFVFNIKMACLWRRTLMSCLEFDEVTISKVSVRLGIKKSVAMCLIDRLQREGYIKCGLSIKGKSNRCTQFNI
jgi:hypothetical protein